MAKAVRSPNLTQHTHLECLCGCVFLSWASVLKLKLFHCSACYQVITVAALVSVVSHSTGDWTSTWWDLGEGGGGGSGGGVGASCGKTYVSVAGEHAGGKRGWAVRSRCLSPGEALISRLSKEPFALRKKNAVEKNKGSTAASTGLTLWGKTEKQQRHQWNT